MGGDVGPPVTLVGLAKALQQFPRVKFLLCGDDTVIYKQIKQLPLEQQNRLSVVHCEAVVEMNESPVAALRSKKNSSMRKAIELVADGSANACVSAGNTGALMTLSYYLLKTLPGIERPALVSTIPNINNKPVFLLDLGANVNSTPDTLFQYGVMGSVLAQQVADIKSPRVALLNVGEEEIKGNAQVKSADQLFRNATQLNYIGYVEGDDIFSDCADVVVTDGFSGNIALKSSEGLAKLIMHEVRKQAQSSMWMRLLAWLAYPLLKSLYNRVKPDQYNGASLIGLRGIVIKSHGNASAEAFYYAIAQAVAAAEAAVPEKIKYQIETVLMEQL